MFSIAFINVLITLLYIVPGFLLCKGKKAVAEHLPTLSGLLVYVCSPALIISSFLKLDFSLASLLDMGAFFLVTLVLQVLFILLLTFIFLRKFENATYRIVTFASVLGNVGFFGLPIIKALFPENPEVMCYSAMYGISMNLLAFTVGVFLITKKKEYMTPKAAVLNSASFALVIGLVCYIFGVGDKMPSVLFNSIDLLGAMTTPLCMLILGVRLATVRFCKLFLRPSVYFATLGKLVLFPLFCYGAVYFIPGLSDVFKASVMVLSATPCASMILNLAEMHHTETELSANSVLVSTLLCFITIPLLVLLL